MAIKQASVRQVRNGEVTRDDGYIVIAMCFYPRGLRKELRDEYRSDLAPERVLFKEFKGYQSRFGHKAGFTRSCYESRFNLSANALEHLNELAQLSRSRDVYFVCQCEVGERCHREMILLAAQKLYGAKIDRVFQSYSVFLKRIRPSIKDTNLS